MTVAVRGSLAHRLDVTAKLVDAALATGASNEVLDELGTGVAVFTSALPRAVNAAWREMFATRALPGAVLTRIAGVAETGVAAFEDEVLLDGPGRPIYVAVALRRRHDMTAVLALCEDRTDAVIARQLAAPPEALLWGGPNGEPADYFSAGWDDDARSTTWQAAIHPADLARCVRARDDAGKHQPCLEVEARLRRRDGRFEWCVVQFVARDHGRWAASATAFATERGQVDRLDQLAEAQAARTDAEHASAMKDQFLAAVSHELRAPLTTILLWEKILRSSASSGMLHVQAIDAIHQSALAQARLVDDLLDVSRAISGKLHVSLEPIDIEAVLASAVSAIVPSALAKQITLERRGPPVTAAVLGDPGRVGQILGNLLANAVKFSKPCGRITLRVASDRNNVTIAIEDTGRGITPELLERLFVPFSQSEDAVTSGAGGLAGC